ncbi:MAG: hypothetical protein IJN65_02475 [Clostridia bacterium]|nr:hypothetical protein [Clostridia bacterium]
MKRLLSALLVFVIIFSLCACKGDNTDNQTVNNSEITSVGSEEQISSDIIIEIAPTGSETNNQPPVVSQNTTASDNTNAQQHTHVYKKAVTAKTCETDGFTTYFCDCGTRYTDDTVLATGHSYGEWQEITAPTEQAAGKEQRVCKNCEKSEQREIPKLIKGHTHKYSATVTKTPTCESDGEKTYSCTCGASYTESIAKTAHNYTKTVVNPTCTTAGYTKNTCECGKTYYDSNVKALGHKYSDAVIAPTCTSGGYTEHTCSVCSYKFTDSATSPTGHKDIKTSTVDATCGTDGIKKEVCGVCNATVKTTTIPATGKHNYVTKTCSEAYTEVVQNNQTLFVENIASYQHKTDWLCKICSSCHLIKQGNEGDVWSKYSAEEQSKIMLNYVNDLRKQYKTENPGYYNVINDKVELVYDAKLTELANIRAKELSTSYSHDTGTRTGASECINETQNTILNDFNTWKASPGHFDGMIMKKGVRFGYGRYVDKNGTTYSCLLIWDKYWNADLWEMTYGPK